LRREKDRPLLPLRLRLFVSNKRDLHLKLRPNALLMKLSSQLKPKLNV